MKLRYALSLLAALPWTLAGAPSSENLPLHRVVDRNAPVVSEANLLESERFWPYQVALTGAWQGVPAGSIGVLIRVEASQAARIDFGRDGLHEVPVAATDLVDRAERIRRGELDKTAPNFVLAIGPRLLDGGSDPLRPLGMSAVLERRAFLAVVADPSDPELAAVAAALSPIAERRELMTILLPHGEHADADVHARLRALSWPTPFVFDHLAEGYIASLVDPGLRQPALLLQTREGRVLFRGTWHATVLPELTAAVDAALGEGATTAA